eukprot:420478_1
MSSFNQALLKWNDTILKNTKTKTLSTEDIKQLLINRGASQKETQHKKSTLIKSLKQNYNVVLQTSLEDLTTNQLIVELKLHGFNNRSARNSILIRRLKDGITAKIAPRRWICYSDKYYKHSTSPIMLNKNEFIVTVYNGILKYNIMNNKWNKWIDFPSKFISKSNIPHSCIGYNNLIYTYDGIKGMLLKINYKTNKHIIFKHLPKIGDGFKCCLVHNQLHLICGSKSNTHWIFDEQKKTFNKFYNFSDYVNGIEEFGLIYIKKNNEMLFMGGKTYEWRSYLCHYPIFSYNIIKHKWKRIKLTLPGGLSNFGYVITNNEKYIILFGGYNNYGYSNDIFVINTKEMVLMKCNIPCPVKNEYDAIIMGNEEKEELIVCGFVKRCWKQLDIRFLFPPKYILKLVQLRISQEYVHLLEYTKKKHWMIPVCDILNNII